MPNDEPIRNLYLVKTFNPPKV